MTHLCFRPRIAPEGRAAAFTQKAFQVLPGSSSMKRGPLKASQILTLMAAGLLAGFILVAGSSAMLPRKLVM